jgi:hypothetical protein
VIKCLKAACIAELKELAKETITAQKTYLNKEVTFKISRLYHIAKVKLLDA